MGDASQVKKTTREEPSASLAAIRAWVKAEAPASRSSFLQLVRAKRDISPAKQENLYGKFRQAMLDAHIWLQEGLAKERFFQLLVREVHRLDRSAADPAQLALPGFEHLPGRIRITGVVIPLESASVGMLLLYERRYQKRVRRDALVAGELQRLAASIRDQPEELSVREALARAEGDSGTRKAAK
jgi:hypothetical protein